jgi:hypothetical protein
MRDHDKNLGMMHRIFNRTKLGDRVHSVAKPIAEVIDKVAGTNIKGCGACAKRRKALNNMFSSELNT